MLCRYVCLVLLFLLHLLLCFSLYSHNNRSLIVSFMPFTFITIFFCCLPHHSLPSSFISAWLVICARVRPNLLTYTRKLIKMLLYCGFNSCYLFRVFAMPTNVAELRTWRPSNIQSAYATSQSYQHLCELCCFIYKRMHF